MKEIEKSLHTEVLLIQQVINELETQAFSSYLYPPIKPNPNYNQNAKFGCENNIAFFNLYHYELKINSLNSDIHDMFWDMVVVRMESLK